ncbi:MAG: phosphate ABC transporter permease PstA [Elusimicrobiota bacterium]
MKISKGFKSFIGISMIKIFTLIGVFIVFYLIGYIFVKGISVINLDFLTKHPSNSMTEGGVLPAIVGSFYLTFLSVIIAIIPGIATSIYLNEYANKGFLVDFIKVSINNLASVPSVVYGLFGLGVFVNYFKFGVSLLSGALTLSVVILPLIISSTLEALKAIPNSLREASMALGATKWYTIRNVLLPIALPSIITGIVLSLARAAGETAPILFTAAVFYMPELPDSIFSEVMALPYHIYALISEGTHPEKQVPIAYGSSLVLLGVVILLSGVAFYVREKSRRIYDKIGH